MKRVLSVAAMAALLVMLLPIGTVVAHNDKNNQGNGNGHSGKVTICHNPNGAHPVKITVAKASWTLKAHMKHGDFIVTAQTPCVPKPKPPKPAQQQVCTFDATTSTYYSGSTNAAPVYATGPIRFSWDTSTGTVKVPGGFWNELVGGTTYFNNVTAGTVTGAGAVNLSFVRTVPDSNSFAFVGTLAGNTVSGLMAGNWFTATGTKTCTGMQHHGDDD